MEYLTLNAKETGKRIKELRKASGYTVEGLAELMELESPQAIYKWQRGDSLPNTKHLYRLSGLLGVTTDEILKGNKSREEDFGPLLPFCRNIELPVNCRRKAG